MTSYERILMVDSSIPIGTERDIELTLKTIELLTS